MDLPVYSFESLYRSARPNDSDNCQNDSAKHHRPILKILFLLHSYFGYGHDIHGLVLILVSVPGGFLIGGVRGGLARRRRNSFILGGLGILLALFPDALIVSLMLDKNGCETGEDNKSTHDGKIVTQKALTRSYYCNTLIGMANVLSGEKQTAIIAALAEGSSIRSIERITSESRAFTAIRSCG